MNEFFAMGGYAMYVWLAFGLTFAVLLGNWLLARRRYAKAALLIRQRRAVQA